LEEIQDMSDGKIEIPDSFIDGYNHNIKTTISGLSKRLSLSYKRVIRYIKEGLLCFNDLVMMEKGIISIPIELKHKFSLRKLCSEFSLNYNKISKHKSKSKITFLDLNKWFKDQTLIPDEYKVNSENDTL